MALSSSSRPSIRGKILTRLPATLQADGGLAVNKVGGVWTFTPDWSALALETSLSDATARQLWAYNPADGSYTRLSAQTLISALAPRDTLTSNRTYYVRTDGSDSNNGLANSAAGGFLTIQKAIDVVAGLDLSIYAVTIQVDSGTYTGRINISSPWVGRGPVTILGNTSSPSSVVISTSGSAITTSNNASISLSGLKITTSSGQGINASSGSVVTLSGNLDFGTVTGAAHMFAQTDAQIIRSTTSYTISGGAAIHWQSITGGKILQVSMTITLTGTPAFSVFAQADRLSYMQVNGNTFVGSATGTRYQAENNSVIYSAGSGATYLPGNSSGSTSSGGIYN